MRRRLLTLNEELLVGQGSHRACYQHPTDPAVCVKVLLNQQRLLKPVRREIEYYLRLAKRDIQWDMLSAYLGEVETNIGVGHLYTLIRDENQEVAKSLCHYLENKKLTTLYYQQLIVAFEKLYQYLMDNKIMVLTMYPRNVVFQLQNEPRLVIIDDIGNPEYFPFSELVGQLGRRKIRRKWQRFIPLLNTMFPDNKVVKELGTIYLTGNN